MEEFSEVFDQVERVNKIPFENYNTILQASVISRFTKLKMENPKLTQGQICKMMNTSPSTLARIRQDLDIASPYRHRIPQKKKKKISEGQKASEGQQCSKASEGQKATQVLHPSTVQSSTSTGFRCEHCSRICKSKSGLTSHTRACSRSLGGGVSLENRKFVIDDDLITTQTNLTCHTEKTHSSSTKEEVDKLLESAKF